MRAPVEYSVPDIRDFVLRVDEVGGEAPLCNLLRVDDEPAVVPPRTVTTTVLLVTVPHAFETTT